MSSNWIKHEASGWIDDSVLITLKNRNVSDLYLATFIWRNVIAYYISHKLNRIMRLQLHYNPLVPAASVWEI
mgnify:CR=1 FL=1